MTVTLRPTEYLECPCCGCEGAFPDADGLYEDGQALLCGCPGFVAGDRETPADIWIDDEIECAACSRDQKEN